MKTANVLIGIGVALCMGLVVTATFFGQKQVRRQEVQGAAVAQATTVPAAGAAPACPLDPAYQFWFPSEETCGDKQVAERPKGMWCDDDGSRNGLLRAWLDEKGVVGYGLWPVKSRSSHSSSGFRWGYYYQVTDIDGGTPKITPEEITAFMVALFGTEKESPHIYLLTITPSAPAVTSVDVGSVYLKGHPELKENICRLAASKGTKIDLQCDPPSGAAKK